MKRGANVFFYGSENHKDHGITMILTKSSGQSSQCTRMYHLHSGCMPPVGAVLLGLCAGMLLVPWGLAHAFEENVQRPHRPSLCTQYSQSCTELNNQTPSSWVPQVFLTIVGLLVGWSLLKYKGGRTLNAVWRLHPFHPSSTTIVFCSFVSLH